MSEQVLNHFAHKLYNKIAAQKHENVFISPFSISTALSMCLVGARNETAQQLKELLHVSKLSDAEIVEINSKYLSLDCLRRRKRSSYLMKIQVILFIIILVQLRSIESRNGIVEKRLRQQGQFIPTNFDLRYDFSSSKCNWATNEEAFCLAQNWALSVANTLGNMYCIKNYQNKTKPIPSSQQLVDCVNTPLSSCSQFDSFDANLIQAINTQLKQGVYQRSSYPQNIPANTPQQCKPQVIGQQNYTGNLNCSTYNASSIQAIQNYILDFGPVIIVTQQTVGLTQYSYGLYNGQSNYNSQDIQQAVQTRLYQVVGWGKITTTSQSYWIAQNTFSSHWGMNGYIQYAQNLTQIQQWCTITI